MDWLDDVTKTFNVEDGEEARRERATPSKPKEGWQDIPAKIIAVAASPEKIDDMVKLTEEGGEMQMILSLTTMAAISTLIKADPISTLKAAITASYVLGRRIGARHGAATAEGRK